MATVCFLDNDIILKLTACNLFFEAISSLGITETDLRVLSDAKYVFRKSGRIARKYPQVIRDNAMIILDKCQDIQPELSEELKYLEIEGIDPGERILISATRKEESFYLTTGDKRCLIALATAPQAELVEIRKRLSGRVICLEQLIFKVITVQGFDVTLPKLLIGKEYDTALKAIFGSGKSANQINVFLALEAYIEELRNKTNGLLAEI